MRPIKHWRNLTACTLAAALLGSSPAILGADNDDDRPRGSPGPGMMHDGGAYGPGMMRGGGSGYGPGMSPGYGNGYGPGYGMMPGYGPGMMPGYGHGPGMMQGYGPMPGYGPMQGPGMGMMPGYGPGTWDQGQQRYPHELTDEQRQRLQRIQREHQERNWELMDRMREEQRRLYRLDQAPTPDWDAIEKSTRRLGELRQQMIERELQTQRRTHELLQGD